MSGFWLYVKQFNLSRKKIKESYEALLWPDITYDMSNKSSTISCNKASSKAAVLIHNVARNVRNISSIINQNCY